MKDPYFNRHEQPLDPDPPPAPHYFQLPFRALVSQYGYFSPPTPSGGEKPRRNAPQGDSQRSGEGPLLDYLP